MKVVVDDYMKSCPAEVNKDLWDYTPLYGTANVKAKKTSDRVKFSRSLPNAPVATIAAVSQSITLDQSQRTDHS